MKNRLLQKQKWIITTCLIAVMLVPTQTYALGISNFIDAATGIFNAAEGPTGVPTAEPAQRTKETCTTIPFIHKCVGPSLDHLAIILLRAVVNKLSDFTVTFINNGFKAEGGAGYATDLSGTLQKELDIQAGNIIYGAGLGKLCSPFQQQVRLALVARQALNTNTSSATAGSCTLSQVSNNIQGFLDGDFTGGGGWSAWYTMTQDPYGNPYSAFLTTSASIDSAQAEAVSLKKEQLAWNVGFFSTQDCLEWVDPDPAHMVGGSSSRDANGNLVIEPYSFGPATADTPGAICQKKGPVKTPGTVVQDELKKVFGSKIDQLNVASNFNQIITALAGQLEKLVFSETTGLFANEASNNGTYTSNSTQGSTGGGATSQCQANPTSVLIGEPVTWTVLTPAGDNTTYQWSGDAGIPTGTTSNDSVTAVYNSEGQKNASVVITDVLADGTTKTTNVACQYPVKVSQYSPLAISCSVNPTRVTSQGGIAVWTITINGGSGGLRFIDLDERTTLNIQNNKADKNSHTLGAVQPVQLNGYFNVGAPDPSYINFWWNLPKSAPEGASLPLNHNDKGQIVLTIPIKYGGTGNWGFKFDQIVDSDINVTSLSNVTCPNTEVEVIP